MRLFLSVCLLLMPGIVLAVDLDGYVAVGSRFFNENGLLSDERRQGMVSANIKHEYFVSDSSYLSIDLFAREDELDPARDIFDANKLFYAYEGENFRFLIGNDVVHWGIVESQSVVNIINQKDLQDFPRGLRRIGQSMIGFNVAAIDDVDVELYLLSQHEPLKFSSPKFRLAQPIRVSKQVNYEASDEEDHVDVAARVSSFWDDFEYGLSYFSGTSREPILNASFYDGEWRIDQFYPLIEQLALETQYVSGEWIAKLEVASVSGYLDRHSKFVAGYEYSFVEVLDTDASIAVVGEYLFDDRKKQTPHFFEDDVFIGARIDANNVNSSKLLIGMFVDTNSRERIFTLEAESRYLNNILVKLRSQIYSRMPSPNQVEVVDVLTLLSEGDKSAFISKEDFWEIVLEYHY